MQNTMKDITGVTVSYDSRYLLENAYNSVRKFHPDMHIIIIDGSDPSSECYKYVCTLASNVTTVGVCGYNIGHGRGMDMAIRMVKTKFALIFDTDTEMLKSPVEQMLSMMDEDTYGVGYLEKTGLDGYEYGAHPCHRGQEFMMMLHPYFHLLQVSEYYKFHPYVHHGAPCYLAALDIHRKGLTSKIIKEFPGLGHSSGKGWNWTGSPREFIRHDTRGTRDVRVKKGKREIEGGWVYESSNLRNRFITK